MGMYVDRGLSLEDAKLSGTYELEAWFSNRALSTFDCNSIGVMYRYECHEAAQLRMLNGRVSNTAVTLWCGPVPANPEEDVVFGWNSHTSAECGKVHTAYLNFVKDTEAFFNAKKSEINAATTVQAVDDIIAQIYAY